MRGHLAVATEAALAQGDLRWGIVGVSLRSPDTRDALQPQDGLYTVVTRSDVQGRSHESLQVIGAVKEVLVAPQQPGKVLERMSAPEARIISLTITEKGYCHDPASGQLRLDHPDIVHDLAHPEAPRSAIGYIVRALALRRTLGRTPLTLMCLDNLPSNGRVLANAVRDLATVIDPTLADWIATHCSFPCSMVDRIVPRTTDADRQSTSQALGCEDAWPVVCESFFDWAIEDHFVAGRPDWSLGGARFVDDAEPWERLKLRMVNGVHSSIAYLGVLAGWAFVDVAVRNPALRRHIEALMQDEIEPTLPALPGLDLATYRAQLLARFANTALHHRTLQIAMDGSQKLPQRLLSTVRERLQSGLPIRRLAVGVAAWLHYLGGMDEQGAPFAVEDPLRQPLMALHQAAVADQWSDASVAGLLGFAPVFGDLSTQAAFVASVKAALHSLRVHGVVAALEAH
ncbi:MAG: mannitol dehydrogenase [Comamonadaceae bacterium PBBC2]|nr:MAG: mannitol dehydrogenase [Comamonadaceae bacterium PBBC2]